MKKSHLLLLSLLTIPLLFFNCQKSKDPDKGYSHLNDLAGKKVGCVVATTQDLFLARNHPDIEPAVFDNYTDMLQVLQNGAVEAIALDDYIYFDFARNFDNLACIDSDFPTENVAAVFPKDGDPAFLSKFNEMVEELRESSVLEEMTDRWVYRKPEAASMPTFRLPTSGDPFKVAISADIPSFGFMEGTELRGFEHELILRFSAAIQRPAEFVIINSSSIINAVASGKADIGISGFYITPERKENVDFSAPYFKSDTYTVILKKNKKGGNRNDAQTDISNFEDAQAGCLIGTMYEAYMAKHHPSTKILTYENYADIIIALKKGQLDYFLCDDYIYYDLAREVEGLELAKNDLPVYDVALAVNKGHNQELLRQFNSFVADFIKTVGYQEMVDRWITKARTVPPMPDFNLPQEGEPIKAVTSGLIPALSFLEGGQLQGMDYELVMRFAEHIRRPVKWQIVPFTSLISSLLTDRADIAISGLYITEERLKSVDFSIPYYRSATASVVSEQKNIPGSEMGEKDILTRIKDSFYNNIILEKRYMLIVDGLKMTFVISLFSILLGTILGGLVCFGRMCRFKTLNSLSNVFINLMRGTPMLVFLLLMYYVVFASSEIEPEYVAILTFALNFAAYVSEMFRTAINSVGKGQTEAGIALGFSNLKTFLYIVLPQAVSNVLPVYKGEMISLVKMTSIVGYIAIQDLTKASDIIRSRTFDALFPLIFVAILYFILAWLFALALDWIGKRTNPHGK